MLTNVAINNLTGLSAKEVELKQKQFGFNELPQSAKRNIFKIIFEVLKEPMLILLLTCGFVYLLVGSLEDALMLLGFVFLIMGLTIFQENKTEKALSSLRDLSSPRALVIRDGIQKRIPGREVVKDDLIIVKEGDRVPADAVLFWGRYLMVDESILTGESVPVTKDFIEPTNKSESNNSKIYSSSLIVAGHGIAKVTGVGLDTEIGKIGKVLKSIEIESTFLQKEIGRLVKFIFILAVICCLLIFVVYGLMRHDWVDSFLAGITLAMAIIPEEFPVILTVFLALGAWRFAKKNVLARRIAAVEILGATTVLAVDKTGTLTENKMTIKKIFNGMDTFTVNKYQTLPEPFHDLIEYGILASKIDPFDPMEKALKDLGVQALAKTEHLHTDWQQIQEYPLSKELLALSFVWQSDEQSLNIIAAKGAPEAIFDLCHLKVNELLYLNTVVEEFAKEGLRVIGVAKAFSDSKLPVNQHDFDFKFIGLVGLTDPVRENVPLAVKECYQAGIRVVMITGDYPSTAQKIAAEIGLLNSDKVITGLELNNLDKKELQEKVKTINVFARILPEQKYLIVDALKANQEIVAMTGDGVNDAPALKAAHIGIAMGERGTDVAREASDLVLVNDDFLSIKEAIKLGRRIFNNLKKALTYTIAVHIPIAGMSLIPVLFGWPIMFFPVHIVFLELIIDPTCSLVFESEPDEKDIMKLPPRNPNQPIFGKKLLLISFFQGLFSLLMICLTFKMALVFGQSETEARTLTFVALIIANLFLVLTNRSWSENIFMSILKVNKTFLYLVIIAMFFLFLVIYVPFFQRIFYFSGLDFFDLVIGSIIGIFSVIWFEVFKFVKKYNFAN
ncbi:MAG: cation-translocating P-type ATPase [Candidatus Margulisiibacteriota bacterium]|jgi:Ca2+-transporting ATPase